MNSCIFSETERETVLTKLLTRAISILLLATSSAVFAEVVKKSTSGICHSPASPSYERTANYRAFDTLSSCLASGGRLPRNVSHQSPVPQVSATAYERSNFGHGWADFDGDCRNSRMEALISQSTNQVRFAEDNCRVISGRWISPFTGNVIHNASDIDIDHVVPLKWAWEHGADGWDQEKRERFANDPVNLWSVELSLNRQKGAKGPEEWLPPAGQCQYVSRFVRIVKVYDLRPSQNQVDSYRQQLADYCG